MTLDFFRKREFLFGTIFGGLNLAILMFGGIFLTTKIIGSNAELIDRKTNIKIIHHGWEEMVQEQRDIVKKKPDLERLNSFFIPEDDPLDFINQIEVLAKKSNNVLEIDLLPGGEQKIENESGTLVFQIYLGGSFINLMHFLGYLENMEQAINLESIQINKNPVQILAAKPDWQNLPAGSVYTMINFKVYTDRYENK